jgi:hypothetical protein
VNGEFNELRCERVHLAADPAANVIDVIPMAAGFMARLAGSEGGTHVVADIRATRDGLSLRAVAAPRLIV